MKIFLSWSGDLSHKIACELREWLPSVLQYAKPYVSSQDIDKGARWSTDIAKELHESSYGILCITKENIEAPWINFEAGALSKTLEKSFVSPFLFDIKRSEVQGPLLQFQSTICDKEDVHKLVTTINGHATDSEKLSATGVAKSFEVWWPQLEKALSKLQEEAPDQGKKKTPVSRQEGLLEEILELARSQQKILRSPDVLLPPDYLEYALSRIERSGSVDPDRLDRLHVQIGDLSELASGIKDKVLAGKIMERAESLHNLFHMVVDGRTRRRSTKRTAAPEDKQASE
jgi:hypothetical protein